MDQTPKSGDTDSSKPAQNSNCELNAGSLLSSQMDGDASSEQNCAKIPIGFDSLHNSLESKKVLVDGPPEEIAPLKPPEKADISFCGKDPDETEELVPPDGGCRAWLVMFGSFLCNGIIFGTINSGGVIFSKLKQIFEDKGIENPASYASLTLSLAIGSTFFISMVAGVLTDRLGIRKTTFVGGFLATLGMVLSSFFYTEEDVLVFTMGVIFGVGASLVYTPSLVILGHYFRKRIGIVNGIVTAGSSIFTILLTKLLKIFITCYDLKATFQLLSALMAVLMICGFIFKPFFPDTKVSRPTGVRPGDVSMRARCHNFFGTFINFKIWKNKRYVIWTFAIPTALFGYFVPYVHLIEYAGTVLSETSSQDNSTMTSPNSQTEATSNASTGYDEDPGWGCAAPVASNITESAMDTQSEILIQCMGGTSLVGRLVFGFLADRPGVNRILLQQISFFCIGTLTMLLTVATQFWMFVAITLGMGLFDGCFISLLGPIAIDIVGPDGASQAIGCLLGMCSIPLTIGPYIAGVLEDNLDSYVIPFLCAGIPPIIGCLALCLLRLVKDPPEDQKYEHDAKVPPDQSPEMEALVTGNQVKDKEEANSQNPKRFVVIQSESSI